MDFGFCISIPAGYPPHCATPAGFVPVAVDVRSAGSSIRALVPLHAAPGIGLLNPSNSERKKDH